MSRAEMSSTEVKPGALIEELTKVEIGHSPEVRENIHAHNIGKWGPYWSKDLTNAWFTDGSASMTSGRTEWTAVALRLKDHMTLREKGKSKSAQHAELITMMLA